jgi:hypothetical protein
MEGGHYPAATTTDRDNIPTWLRIPGMTCGVSADNSLWQLDNDLVTWHPAGGGGGSFGTWTALPSKNTNIINEDIDFEYRIDAPTDITKVIIYIRAQFSLNSAFTGTGITLGVLPSTGLPKQTLRRLFQNNNINIYLTIDSITGEVKLTSKDNFNLPVLGNGDIYTIQEFYKPVPVSTVTYTNIHTVNFTKNDCSSGYSGSTVSFSRTYTSTISQADADAQAAADTTSFNTAGQAYANANGTCTLVASGYIYVNNGSSSTIAFVAYTGPQSGHISGGTPGTNTTTAVTSGNYDINVKMLGDAYVSINGVPQGLIYAGTIATVSGVSTPIYVTVTDTP